MDVERLLVSRIIQDGDFTPVAENNVTGKFFLDQTNHAVFESIVKHVNNYGTVPTLAAMKADFPTYKFVRVEEPYAFLIDRIRRQHSLAIIAEGMNVAVSEHDDQNVEGAISALVEIIQQVATDVPNTRDVDITTTGDERLAYYEEISKNPGKLKGVPTGFDSLDKATLGWQPENLIYFVGPPKAGKSTLLLLCAIAVHQLGLKPLVFTFEMSTQEMAERMDAIRARVGHSRLRSGSLTKDEWKRLTRFLHSFENSAEFWFSSDTMASTGLSAINAKVEQIQPDIVFIDGVYLIHDEISGEVNTTTALTNLSRGFKRLAQNKRLPVVATSQVLLWKMDKKKGVTTGSIGYTSAFAQDADVLIAVEGTEDDEIQKVKILEARNVGHLETYVHWDWDKGVFEELTENPFAEAEGGGWDDKGDGF